MDMTFWLPQTKAALAQVDKWDVSGHIEPSDPRDSLTPPLCFAKSQSNYGKTKISP